MVERVVAKVSGGVGSWCAARRWVDEHFWEGGKNDPELTLVFTDTLCEDQDAYRFLIEGAANVFGVYPPPGSVPEIDDFPAWEDRAAYKAFVLGLAAQTMRWLPGLQWLSDGRDPWDVYEAERFLGNSRADPCSKILKRKVADRWLAQNCDPAATQVIVGLDYEEIERFEGDGKSRKGLRATAAEAGWTFIAPLCDQPYWSWQRRIERVRNARLWVPRLTQLGFAHNNCGGFCCKGGQGHWKLMLRTFPERYAYAEAREQQIRDLLGDVSMLTDRRGGDGKKPLTLAALRERDLTQLEMADLGACGCFFGDAA